MSRHNHQPGFSIIEILIVIVVIGIVGLLGYTFYSKQMDKTVSDGSSQAATVNDVESAPEVNSVSDLEKAEAILDQTDPSETNDTDASQLDAELANF